MTVRLSEESIAKIALLVESRTADTRQYHNAIECLLAEREALIEEVRGYDEGQQALADECHRLDAEIEQLRGTVLAIWRW